jgi:hypothetical protein
MHCSVRFACVAVVLAGLGACQSLPPELTKLASIVPGAGPAVAGGNYPEAYACHRVAVAVFDGDQGERIAGEVEAGLSRLASYRLVDRRKLAGALDELGFQRSALVDAATAARVGKLVGADCILTGSVNLAKVDPESYTERVCVVMGAQLPVPSDNLCPGRMTSVSCTGLKADAVLVPRLVQVESGAVVYAQTASGQAVDRSCHGNLLDTPASRDELEQQAIDHAIEQVVADLTPKTGAAGGAVAAADTGTCPRLRNPSDVREAQQMLTGLGYAPGTPDGQAGGRTTQALRQFQQDTGYQPADGVLSSCAVTAITSKYVASLQARAGAAPAPAATTQGVSPAAGPAPRIFEDLGLK